MGGEKDQAEFLLWETVGETQCSSPQNSYHLLSPVLHMLSVQTQFTYHNTL